MFVYGKGTDVDRGRLPTLDMPSTKCVHAQYNELQEKDVQNAMCKMQCNLQLNTRGMQLIS